MATDYSKLVDPAYSQVGVRDSAAAPGTAEYYNKQTNQGFSDPNALAGFVSQTYGGDVNAGNVFDVLKTPYAPTQPTQQAQQAPAKTRQQTLQEALFSNPVSSANIYQEEFDKAGLGDYKSRLADLDKQIEKIRSKYTETAGKINENPWLSEASRVGRARILNDQMQAEIGNYLEQRNQLADLYNMGMNEVKLRAGLRSDDANAQRSLMQQELEFILNQNQTDQSRKDAALEFAINNNIQSPFFNIGGTIYRTSDLKAYSNPAEFFADGGAQDWSNVQTIEQQSKLLSPTEAARLGVPYGTTQEEAAALAITPNFGKSSSGSSRGSSSGTGLKSTADSSGEIKSWIIANKRANPDVPYYELWGQLADELQRQGLDPTNYDKVFWEVLHPEGLAGYQKEQEKKKQEPKRSI